MWYPYWKNQNKKHLFYLFKIVYNKPIYVEEEEKEDDRLDLFCKFIYDINYESTRKEKEKKEYKKGVEDEKEDDIYYIYYFLKDYDNNGCLTLFSKLTFDRLKDFLNK
jgi:hypothetical protein